MECTNWLYITMYITTLKEPNLLVCKFVVLELSLYVREIIG